MHEIAYTTRSYAELSGRTQAVVGDVVVTLVNLGLSLNGIVAFAKRDSRALIPTPQIVSTQKQMSLLQAGTKQSHPPHIPHFLPQLPDPHAYIRTPVSDSAIRDQFISISSTLIHINIFISDAQTTCN